MSGVIHPVFRWVRSCGFRADRAVETRTADGQVRVEQWIWTPDVGWDRYVETVDPQVFVRWELSQCPEVRAADEDRQFKARSTGQILARLEAEGCSVSFGTPQAERTNP